MSLVYLSLGSNLDDRILYIQKAKELLSINIGDIMNESGFYETPPWGMVSENRFINQVILIETKLLPQNLLKETQKIEKSIGRLKTQSSGYEDRIIDIDILFYDDLVMATSELTIPHPHIENRRFVLEPLCEIANNFIHPIIQKTIEEILKNTSDISSCERL